MRSLWTSASGLNAQQQRMDSIANNLANLNTTGYKTQDVQFKDILYANYLQKPEVGAIKDPAFPRASTLGLRIGQGVHTVGMSQAFTQGSLQQTEKNSDLAIEGSGFFKVQIPGSQDYGYTRDGSFKFAETDDQRTILTDASGRPIMDGSDQEIDLTGYDLSTVKISTDGQVTGKMMDGTAPTNVPQIDLVNISDPQTNLVPAGNNLYALNGNIPAANLTNIVKRGDYTDGKIRQGQLEQSNVDMSAMMTEMIQAQRIYSMNAKALETTDQMMGMANNLRG